MCGIFGTLVNKNASYPLALLEAIVNNLFKLSESRGKEAAGIAVISVGNIKVYKKGIIASVLIRSKAYRLFIQETITAKPIAIIGHARLATHGSQINNDKNSPIICGNTVGIHNGIIVNEEELWKVSSILQRTCAVDSESLFAALDFLITSGLSLIEATKSVFYKIEGSASFAFTSLKYNDLVLGTNTGSLYCCRNTRNDIYIFASEGYILEKLIKKLKLKSLLGEYSIAQIKAGEGRLINLQSLSENQFNLK